VQKYLKADSSEQGNDFSHSTKHEDICLAEQLATTQRLFNGVYQLVKTVITSYYYYYYYYNNNNNNNNNNNKNNNNNDDDDDNDDENDNISYYKK
jgi:hypothetical protein